MGAHRFNVTKRGGCMSNELRITHWAQLVVELDEMLNNSLYMSVQSKEVKKGLYGGQAFLTSIYNKTWSSVDIGYPNTIAVMKGWGVEIDYNVDDPVGILKSMRLMLASIRLDMMAVVLAKDEVENSECSEN
jgi:hypothetical protein